MNTVLLYSGGLDSYIAWHYLNRPKTIYIPLGHRYQHRELLAIGQTIRDTRIIPSCDIGLMEAENAHLPGRNLLLAYLAALWTPKAERVILVCQRDEMEIPDRSETFFTQTSAVLSFVLQRKLVITTPFADMDKTDMVGWYVSEGLPTEMLMKTRSCYANTELPCGECSACLRRFIALRLNGLMEDYLKDPRMTPLADEYRRRANQGHYSLHRANRIRAVLGEQVTDLLPINHGSEERHK